MEQCTHYDDAASLPRECPNCGGKLRYERFDDEPDTGCVACIAHDCEACELTWTAPPPRKEH